MNGGRALAVSAVLAAIAAAAVLYSRTSSVPVAMNPPPPLPIRDPRVLIRKKARELCLYDGLELRKTYAIALAADVRGDKEREGDRKTPEGTFYVCSRNGASHFHKVLGL